jgi:phosphoribosylglycinamide formyltransferase-1
LNTIMIPVRPRLAVLLSGGGTSLQNLLDRERAGTLAGTVTCVASDRDGVGGLQRAQSSAIPSTVIRRRDFSDRQAFSDSLIQWCEQHGADLICLAGFLQLLTVPPRWENRVINIHPSL